MVDGVSHENCLSSIFTIWLPIISDCYSHTWRNFYNVYKTVQDGQYEAIFQLHIYLYTLIENIENAKIYHLKWESKVIYPGCFGNLNFNKKNDFLIPLRCSKIGSYFEFSKQREEFKRTQNIITHVKVSFTLQIYSCCLISLPLIKIATAILLHLYSIHLNHFYYNCSI